MGPPAFLPRPPRGAPLARQTLRRPASPCLKNGEKLVSLFFELGRGLMVRA